MKLYKVQKVQKVQKRKKNRKNKSHVGKMEGAYNPPNWSGKLDTRLTPVHRYTLQETNFPVIVKS